MKYMAAGHKYPFLMRKWPSQSRSEHLVDCILAGAVRILSRAGFSRMDTKSTAKEAGISVGSLYQYFPNRESIFARIMEQEGDKARLRVVTILETARPKSLEQLCHLVIDAMVEMIWNRPRLFREILRYAQALDRQSYVHRIRYEVVETLHEYCLKNGIRIESSDAKLSLFVLANAVQGTIEACVLYEGLEMTEAELKTELKRMAIRFLSPSSTENKRLFNSTMDLESFN